MKQIIFLLVMIFAVPVAAQAPAKPEAMKAAAKPEPAKDATKPGEMRKQTASGAPRIPNPRRWHEDARHCLDLPTNTEVIKCAEEYL